MATLLPLHKISIGEFYSLLEEGDLTVVGEGTAEELIAHANELTRQFNELLGSDENLAQTMLTAQIAALDFKLDFVQKIIDLLRVKYDERLIEILIDEDFDIKFSPEKLLENLEQVISECQQYVFQKKDLEQQLEKLSEGGRPANREYLADTLVAISMMVKANIDDKINVLLYCRYHKQLYTKLDKPETEDDGG